MKLFVILGLLATVALASATDYCSSNLCPVGTKHIACGNSGDFDSSCPADAYLVNLQPYIQAILHSHNDKRNQIASGSVSPFLPAARMGTMQWDDELASIATFNVKQCTMKHDQCRNTDTFPTSGQNLAMSGSTAAVNSAQDEVVILGLIDSWYSEHKDTTMSQIDKYPSNYNGPTIGHFTGMVGDNNIRVGCAAARYFKSPFNYLLLACNYANTNIIGRPIYVSSSTAASGCTATNPLYTSLCSTDEVY